MAVATSNLPPDEIGEDPRLAALMRCSRIADKYNMLHTCAVLAGFFAIVMAPCLSAYRLFLKSAREANID